MNLKLNLDKLNQKSTASSPKKESNLNSERLPNQGCFAQKVNGE